MTDIAAAARISAYVAERKRHLDTGSDVIHGFGLGPDAKVLRASDIRAVLADLSGLTRPERCQDCATDPAGPCGICAIAIYGDVDGLAYLDARDERNRLTVENHERRRDWYTLTHIIGCLDEQPADEVFADARTLVAEQDEAKRRAATVRDFIAERGQVITAINNCHPDNTADYHRWQGHAESRRQLAERLDRKETDRG